MVRIYLMWVEVRVKDDNGISGVKVDTNPTSPRSQKVDEDIRAGFIEFINALLPERARCIAILGRTISDYRKTMSVSSHQSKVFNPLPIQEIFNYIKNKFELHSVQ